MSSFISSLLTDLGLLNRSPRHTHLEQTTSPPSEDSSISSPHQIESPPFLSQNRDCTESESITRDAGTLPAAPLFTSLPKDMDARNSDFDASRLMPQNASTVSEIRDADSVREGANNIATDQQRVQTGHDESTNPSNAPPDNTSRLARESNEELSNNQERISNIDEPGQTSLPADDGMSCLRNKIHAIRDLDLNSDEKARMVHDLMTENYKSSQPVQPTTPGLRSPSLDASASPSSPAMISPDVRRASLTLAELEDSPPEETFTLTESDLQPTFVPKIEPDSPLVETGDDDPDTEELDGALLGCEHYMRNVKLQCFACKKWYTCRFCHDGVEDHALVRRDTQNMLCMLCGHPQPADQDCRKCGEQSAQYYCDICKLWDNDSKKSIYHCNDCGICRIGQGLGKDFFHCKTCCVCLPISIEDTHRCIERSTQCDCPICGEYMFTSPETVVVMRCGHSIHHKCLGEYSKNSFRCPICSKTITNMESTFRNLDRTIESQPMPAEFQDTKALIYCNDCAAKSIVKYHWLGFKCDLCESYNTAQIRLLQGDVSAVLEQEGVSGHLPRTRSSSLNATDESATSFAALHLNTNPESHPHLNVPTTDGSDQRIVSYNMTRGRAISPIVSNYFGLPPERESEKPSSLPFFGGPSRTDSDTDYGALNFLSKKLRDRYGFLAGDTAVESVLEADEDEDEDAGSSSSSSSDEQEGGNEDEEDEDDEYIDIFGHR